MARRVKSPEDVQKSSGRRAKRKKGKNGEQDFEGDPKLKGGPPCLQHLFDQKLTEGEGQNNLLFEVITYAKTAYTGREDWEAKVRLWNERVLDPPYTADKLAEIIRNHDKKDYQGYGCKKIPICNYCNPGLCKTRPYGIGKFDSDIARYISIDRIRSKNPVVMLSVEVNGAPYILNLSVHEFMIHSLIREAACGQWGIYLPRLSVKDWDAIQKDLLERATIIDPPEEHTEAGMLWSRFMSYVYAFGHRAESLDMAIGHAAFLKDNTCSFKLRHFLDFLRRDPEYKDITDHALGAKLKELLKAERVIARINGEVTRYWNVTMPNYSGEPIPLPSPENKGII